MLTLIALMATFHEITLLSTRRNDCLLFSIVVCAALLFPSVRGQLSNPAIDSQLVQLSAVNSEDDIREQVVRAGCHAHCAQLINSTVKTSVISAALSHARSQCFNVCDDGINNISSACPPQLCTSKACDEVCSYLLQGIDHLKSKTTMTVLEPPLSPNETIQLERPQRAGSVQVEIPNTIDPEALMFVMQLREIDDSTARRGRWTMLVHSRRLQVALPSSPSSASAYFEILLSSVVSPETNSPFYVAAGFMIDNTTGFPDLALNFTHKLQVGGRSQQTPQIHFSWNILPGFSNYTVNSYQFIFLAEDSNCLLGEKSLTLPSMNNTAEALIFPQEIAYLHDYRFNLLFDCSYSVQLIAPFTMASQSRVLSSQKTIHIGDPPITQIEPVRGLVVTARVNKVDTTWYIPESLDPSLVHHYKVFYFVDDGAFPAFEQTIIASPNATKTKKYEVRGVLFKLGLCSMITVHAYCRGQVKVASPMAFYRVCIPTFHDRPPVSMPDVSTQYFHNLFMLFMETIPTVYNSDFPKLRISWRKSNQPKMDPSKTENATNFRIAVRTKDSKCLAAPQNFQESLHVDMNMMNDTVKSFLFPDDLMTKTIIDPYPAYGCRFYAQLEYLLENQTRRTPPVQLETQSFQSGRIARPLQAYVHISQSVISATLRFKPPAGIPPNFIIQYGMHLTRVQDILEFGRSIWIKAQPNDTTETTKEVQITKIKTGVDQGAYFQRGYRYQFSVYTSFYRDPVYGRNISMRHTAVTGGALRLFINVPAAPTSQTVSSPTSQPVSSSPSTTGNGLGDAGIIAIAISACVIVAVLLYCCCKNYHRYNPRFVNFVQHLTWTNENIYHGADRVDGINDMELEAPDKWEISMSSVHMLGELGEGAFGKVCKARVITNDNEEKIAAAKMLHGRFGDLERNAFFREIALMKEVGHHPNVVGMVGCCTRDVNNPLLLVEFAPHNNVLEFIKLAKACHSRQKWKLNDPELKEDTSYFNDPPPQTTAVPPLEITEYGILADVDFLKFAYDIANGMKHLHTLRIIHRDLAARNVLVGENKRLMVSDFGLAKDIYLNENYVQKSKGRLPYRWMAIEALRDRRYSTASDVWSFGVTLWEILTLGGYPYPTVTNEDILDLLVKGYRLPRPDGCSKETYELMESCWQENVDNRPLFDQLVTVLEDKLCERKAFTDYIDFSGKDID